MFVAPAVQRCGRGRKPLAAFERSFAAIYIGVYLQTGGQLSADKFYASYGHVTSRMVSVVRRIEV